MQQPPPFFDPPVTGPPFAGVPSVETTPIITGISPDSDRLGGGATLTLTGIRFTGPATVTLGGVPATNVVVVSSTSITCTVPLGVSATYVDLVLTTSGGVYTLVSGFFYYQGVISTITPATGSIGGATNVAIAGFNFIAGCTILFGGVPATNVIFIDSQNYACTTPAHVLGFVDVVITEPSTATSTLRNGFQYTALPRGNDIRRNPGVTVSTQLGNSPNSASFKIDQSGGRPVAGERITITDVFDSNRLLFAGNISTVQQLYEEDITKLAWACTATDPTWMFSRRRPVGKYSLVSASQIVVDLVRKYAPGFTTEFVQTNLAPFSITLDGTDDFPTVLTTIAKGIGGAHWYIDYNQVVHFFHVKPPDFKPLTPISLGPGTSMVAQDGPAMPSLQVFNAAYYYFRSTFLYSNGVESRLSPISNVHAYDGTKQIELASIPIGADPGGGITCIGRRIYYITGAGQLRRGWKINDNVTTLIDVYPGKPSFGTVIDETGLSVSIVIPATSPPPLPYTAPAPTVQAAFGGATNYNPATGAGVYVQAWYGFKVAPRYADGTIGQPSLESNFVYIDLQHHPVFTSLPLFQAINGVAPIAYRVYARVVQYALTPDPNTPQVVPVPSGVILGAF